MITAFLLLSIPIITEQTTIAIPWTACYDMAIFSASFDTRDPRPIYGLQLTAYDHNQTELGGAWVQESYVPPMTETVPLLLPPATAFVRCEVFGTDLTGKWRFGEFRAAVILPELHIARDGDYVVLSWNSACPSWVLESRDITLKKPLWHPADSPRVSIHNAPYVQFRLRRNLLDD